MHRSCGIGPRDETLNKRLCASIIMPSNTRTLHVHLCSLISPILHPSAPVPFSLFFVLNLTQSFYELTACPTLRLLGILILRLLFDSNDIIAESDRYTPSYFVLSFSFLFRSFLFPSHVDIPFAL